MKNIIYKCPLCDKPLFLVGASFFCEQKHAFDISKDGYVNLLLPNQKSSREPGDSKISVRSRRSFLNSGYYDLLSNKLNETVSNLLIAKTDQINILDIGCGEGFYLAKLKQNLSAESKSPLVNYWGLDVSKPAIQLAIKRDSSINLCVGNAYSLPYVSDTIDIALSIFAPVDSEEVARVLKKDGFLIMVVPGKNHLSELVKLVYEKTGQHSEEKDPIKGSTKLFLVDVQDVSGTIHVRGKDLISDLLLMTPYYWHINTERKLALEKLDELITEIDFRILIYKKQSWLD